MGWGRQDDQYWRHRKTEALVEHGDAGLRAIGAFWLLNSYCNAQHRPTFTIWEAAMVLHRSNDEAERILEPLLLRFATKHPFKRGFLLRKQDGSYEINSWAEYKGKSEAKVIAGAIGGKKSGESRRQKREAESKLETKQNEAPSSRGEAPGSRIPIPDPDPGSRSRIPEMLERVDQVVQAVFEEKLGLARPGPLIEHRLLGALPVKRAILDTALESLRGANHPNWTYFVDCLVNPIKRGPGSGSAPSDVVDGTRRHLERIRKEAETEAATEQPALPPPKERGHG